MSEENTLRQDEEIEILKAIYNESNEKCVVSKMFKGLRVVDIHISAIVTIRATLPLSYPSVDGPLIEVIGRNISEADRIQAIEYFRELYDNSEHDVVLFSCVEWAKEHFGTVPAEECEVVIHPDDKSHEDIMSVQYEGVSNDWNIFHGEPLVDRKSVFQAHVAAITHPSEAAEVLAILKQDRKIVRATHNIMAYRIVSDKSETPLADQAVYADNDDDGEDGAGPKLAELLYLMGAQNVIVVVSRWYGGIHLGPDRFKHIANVARTAVEQCGLSGRACGGAQGGGAGRGGKRAGKGGR